MSSEEFRIGQRVVYRFWDHHKGCMDECEADIIWLYSNEKAEIRLIEKSYKVELVNLIDLKNI